MSELPTNFDDFFRAGAEIEVLESCTEPPGTGALERLGPSPFPKGRFPFLGFLATVYDHVATHSRARTQK